MNGETSPSVIAVASVAGLVTNSQTVAPVNATTTIATAVNRLTPRRIQFTIDNAELTLVAAYRCIDLTCTGFRARRVRILNSQLSNCEF
jgi:hypothetical protein